MRWIVAGLGLASLIVAGSSLALVPAAPSFPGKGHVGTFLIAPNDGYGIADCLTSGSGCGRTVAESYCRSKGFETALTFGPVAKDDITGTTSAKTDRRGDTVLTITCEN